MNEASPLPQLDDPSKSARAFADALAGIVESQQRRLAIAEGEITSLRRMLRNLNQAADTAELLIRKDYPDEASYLRGWVSNAKTMVG